MVGDSVGDSEGDSCRRLQEVEDEVEVEGEEMEDEVEVEEMEDEVEVVAEMDSKSDREGLLVLLGSV